MNSRCKILATVSLIGLMAIAPLHTAMAAEEDILEQLRVLQERLDKQEKELSELRKTGSEQKRDLEILRSSDGKYASEIDKQNKEIKAIKTENGKLFSEARKNNDKRSNEALSNEALYNVGVSEEGVFNSIFEAMEDHEVNAHASKLAIGGWADFVYLDNNKPNAKKYMEPHHVYLYFDAKLDPQWRAYAEVEYEHVPELNGNTGSGAIKFERAYIEHNQNALLNARFGKYSTPVGIWTPEHWAINVPSIQKPIHEDNGYVPIKQVGIQAFGDYYSKSDNKYIPDVHYDVWMSQGAEVVGTNAPVDDKFAYGANLSGMFNEMFKVGLTLYSQSNPATGVSVHEFNYFPYVQLDLPYKVTLTGEYLRQDRDAGLGDLKVWYASAQWWFHEKAYIYYRRDQGDDIKRATEVAGTSQEHTGNVFTLGFWPKSYVRTKFEYSKHNFTNPVDVDYSEWAAFIGVTF